MENSCKVNTKPKSFRALIRSWYFWKPVTAIVVGASLGFAYYYFIGCSSGSCAITSNPFGSMLMGGLMGLFVVNSPCRTC